MKERIIFLALAAALLLGAFALAPRLEAREAPEEIRLAVATDPHYLADELTDFGECYMRVVTDADGKAMPRITELMRAFASEMAREGPDALIITGDLTFNGERLSHERLAEKLGGIEAAGVPVYVIPGNHDLENPAAARFEGGGYELVDSVTAEEFAEIYSDFGYSEAISRDGRSLSYTARIAPGLRLLCVDVNASQSAEWVSEGSLEWIESELAAARAAGDRVIAASHQNLYMHNPLFLSGYTIANSAQLEALYAEYGVIANLSGHIHLQHTRSERVPELVTSSLAVSPNQYGLITVTGSGCAYRVKSVDAGGDFAEWSAGFFHDTAVSQALAELGDYDNAAALAEFYASANAKYFAGRPDEIAWDEGIIDEWSSRSFFTPMYLESIRADAEDHSSLSWDFPG
ncbi:MAG TPA: metallophosphoesterase [Candidatus Scatomorpha stercoravium]|nr:metallophosphoesterase [Candidatus Scatomorpha stercoravium]